MLVSVDEREIDEALRRMGRDFDLNQFQRWAADPVAQSLLLQVGYDIGSVCADRRATVWALLQAARHFGPLGWAVSVRNLPETVYVEAVAAWEARPDPAEIDRRLTEAWNDRVWLLHSFGPMTPLGSTDHEFDILALRDKLLTRAMEHHLRREYDASTLIVLTQIDGLTFDYSGDGGFFADTGGTDFTDTVTVAGMPNMLARVWKSVIRTDIKTSASTSFRRAPIVHGRYPAFGTETNSAKAFALLAVVIEWLRARSGN
jgi:hypothetical protein